MSKKSNKRVSNSTRKQGKTSLIIITAAFMLILFVLVAQIKMPQNIGTRAQSVTITNCDVTPTDATIDTEEQKLLDLINDYRQKQGAVKLKISPNLTRAATWLASDMNRSGRLDHTDSTGRAFELRIVQCGYDGNSSAENISNRAVTAAQVLEGWAGSPPHNSNLLNTNYTVAGIARAGSWWALDLGSTDDSTSTPLPSVPPTVPSVVISSGPVVPNPGCLGSCVTTAPSQPIISQQPITTPNPNEPVAPNDPDNENPDEDPEISPFAEPDGGNQNKGLIGFLLEFLKLILEFFMSLIGRN